MVRRCFIPNNCERDLLLIIKESRRRRRRKGGAKRATDAVVLNTTQTTPGTVSHRCSINRINSRGRAAQRRGGIREERKKGAGIVY